MWGEKKMDFRALEIKEETLRLWESGFFLWKFLSCIIPPPHTSLPFDLMKIDRRQLSHRGQGSVDLW